MQTKRHTGTTSYSHDHMCISIFIVESQVLDLGMDKQTTGGVGVNWDVDGV